MRNLARLMSWLVALGVPIVFVAPVLAAAEAPTVSVVMTEYEFAPKHVVLPMVCAIACICRMPARRCMNSPPRHCSRPRRLKIQTRSIRIASRWCCNRMRRRTCSSWRFVCDVIDVKSDDATVNASPPLENSDQKTRSLVERFYILDNVRFLQS